MNLFSIKFLSLSKLDDINSTAFNSKGFAAQHEKKLSTNPLAKFTHPKNALKMLRSESESSTSHSTNRHSSELDLTIVNASTRGLVNLIDSYFVKQQSHKM